MLNLCRKQVTSSHITTVLIPRNWSISLISTGLISDRQLLPLSGYENRIHQVDIEDAALLGDMEGCTDKSQDRQYVPNTGHWSGTGKYVISWKH